MKKKIKILPKNKKEYEIKKANICEEYERCIICGQTTSIPVSLPITRRQNYQVGCGQLCKNCAKIYS